MQYVEGRDAIYTNGTLQRAYVCNLKPLMYGTSITASYVQMTVTGSFLTAVPSDSMVGIPIICSMGASLIYGGIDSTRHSLDHTSWSTPAMLAMVIKKKQKKPRDHITQKQFTQQPSSVAVRSL